MTNNSSNNIGGSVSPSLGIMAVKAGKYAVAPDSLIYDIYVVILSTFVFLFLIWAATRAMKRKLTLRFRPKDKAMLAGFRDAVAETSLKLRSGENESASPLSFLTAGKYFFSVDLKEHEIRDYQTRNLLVDESFGQQKSILTLDLSSDKKNDGWILNGRRTVASDSTIKSYQTSPSRCYEIQDGWVSPSGETYWVESGDDRQLLTVGKFKANDSDDDLSFDGEWLSSKGERGRYACFRKIQESKIWIAVPVINSSGNEEADELVTDE